MSTPEQFKFRLFVDGKSANAVLAIANLNDLCREQLPGAHQIEIVDVTVEPERALADGVLLTPTLIKLSPLPVRKIIGNLSQRRPLMLALGLPELAA